MLGAPTLPFDLRAVTCHRKTEDVRSVRRLNSEITLETCVAQCQWGLLGPEVLCVLFSCRVSEFSFYASRNWLRHPLGFMIGMNKDVLIS